MNTQIIEPDINALVSEVPRLEGLPVLISHFMAAVNQDDGIINQYLGYRQNRLKLAEAGREVDRHLGDLADNLDGMRVAVSDRITQTVAALDESARRSEQLVYWLLSLVVIAGCFVCFGHLGVACQNDQPAPEGHTFALGQHGKG